MAKHGHFHWNELMSWDAEKAKQFYSAVLGWQFESMPGPGDEPYYIATDKKRNFIGGILSLTEEHQGVPESWFAYIAVDDVDARCGRFEAGGGSVLRPPVDVQNIGRIAIVRDGNGAALGLITPANPDTAKHKSVPSGFFSWNELMSWDAEKARKFYADAIGWELEAMPAGVGGGVYYVARSADAPAAGIFACSKEEHEGVPESWFAYVKVDDVDASCGAVKEAGGAVLRSAEDIGEFGRFAVIGDAGGAALGLLTPSGGS